MIQTQSNLALSYAQAGYLVNNQQFGTWNGTATSAGLVTQYGKTPNTARAVNIYRTDWQGRQLLYPTARTNYCPTSQTFSAWSQQNTGWTFATSTILAPDGVTYLEKLTPSSATTNQIYTYTNQSQLYVAQTIWLAYGSTAYQYVTIHRPAWQAVAIVDLLNGLITPLNGVTATIASAPNGAWKVEIWGGATWGASNVPCGIQIDPSNSSGTDIATDGTSFFYAWGAQAEGNSGGPPTAYIANSTTGPLTLTDYTLTGTTVNLAQAPASTATTNATFYAT